MFLWDRSAREVLSVLISSTDQKLYTNQIIKESSLAYSTVYMTLARLTEAEVVIREDEQFGLESPAREARVYYSINPEIIDYLRL